MRGAGETLPLPARSLGFGALLVERLCPGCPPKRRHSEPETLLPDPALLGLCISLRFGVEFMPGRAGAPKRVLLSVAVERRFSPAVGLPAIGVNREFCRMLFCNLACSRSND